MAFLARIDPIEGQPVTLPTIFAAPPARPNFSDLEWSIVRLARGDRLSTIREPSLLRRFTCWLTGRNANPRLASDRLEALRRIAVLSWHFGFTVPGEDVADFLSAGFTPDQYELLVSSVREAARPNVHSISGEVLA